MVNDPKKPSSHKTPRSDAEIEAEGEAYWTEERMKDAAPRPIGRPRPKPGKVEPKKGP